MKSLIAAVALALFLCPLSSFVLAQESNKVNSQIASLARSSTNGSELPQPELNFAESRQPNEEVTPTGLNDSNPTENWAEKETEIQEKTFSNAIRVLCLGVLFIGSAILGLVFYDRRRGALRKRRERHEEWG